VARDIKRTHSKTPSQPSETIWQTGQVANVLRCPLRLAHDLRCLPTKRYAFAAQGLHEVGVMVGRLAEGRLLPDRPGLWTGGGLTPAGLSQRPSLSRRQAL
jgi:hypothetical protein